MKTVNLGLKKFKNFAVLYYYRASIYSLMGKFKLAIRNLKFAVEGILNILKWRSNACFKSMLDTVEFENLLSQTLISIDSLQSSGNVRRSIFARLLLWAFICVTLNCLSRKEIWKYLVIYLKGCKGLCEICKVKASYRR